MVPFDAELFVRELDAGTYNNEIFEEIRKLTKEQLQRVADVPIRQRQERGRR